MASSEGQTELLSGWSCVVHQPSEDPEPSELPSTVDITAFSGGLNAEPVEGANSTTCHASDSDSDSESGSHGSGSGSGSGTASDSSDSESSSTSTTSRSPSPEFSVTSQTPGQLRMTIATVRKLGSEALPSSPTVTTSTATSGGGVAKEKRFTSSESGESSDSETSPTTMTTTTSSAPVTRAGGRCAAKAAPLCSDANASKSIAPPPPPPPTTRMTRLRRALPVIADRKQERRTSARRENNAKEKDVSPRVLRERVRLKRKKVSALMDKTSRGRRRWRCSRDEAFYAIHITVVLFFIAVCYFLTYFWAD